MVPSKRRYLVESILPANEVHLLAGPSGSGKTRILFKWLKEWRSRQTFLGFKALPARIGYVALDRSSESVAETMFNVCPDVELEWKSLLGEPVTITSLLNLFDCDLLIIDGIATLVPEGRIIDYKIVSKFLTDLARQARAKKITILGILHSAKTKEGESFLNPRQRIAGSVSWAAYSETIFILDPLTPDKPGSCIRRLFVLPRNSAEFTRDFTFTPEGQLEEVLPVEPGPSFSDSEQVILDALADCPDGLERGDFLDRGALLGLSASSIDRSLRHLVELGIVSRASFGRYTRSKSN